MQSTTLAFLTALGALAPATLSQSVVRPFPLSISGREPALDALILAPRADEVLGLAALEHVTLIDAPLPGGRLVDVVLERLDPTRLRCGLRVDGAPRPDLLTGGGLSIWKGVVAGEPGSEVMLSFSRSGCRGWIATGGELLHLMPRPDGAGNWSAGDALLVSEAALAERGFDPPLECSPRAVPGAPVTPLSGAGGGGAAPGACPLRECRVALESDYQLYQVFGDLNAMTSYVLTLLTFVSDRYEQQVDAVLTFPYVQFYTTANDPWFAQDGGGSCTAVLYEFQAAWAGNVPEDADLAHMLSGANLGCGVAWLDVLCNDQFNFSVSGNINGNVSFPVVQQPNNWDFMVVAHELGHNFGTPHTHDYCPPLDECAPAGYFGQCQTQQACTPGTIMSYCHLCPGGTGNITTLFHPVTADVMKTQAGLCLPPYVGLAVQDPPALVLPGQLTPVQATLAVAPLGPVELHYRLATGPFQSVPMTDVGGGLFEGLLPAALCGDRPNFYVTYDAPGCALFSDPPGAPAAWYTVDVGALTTTFTDDFETDQGWTTGSINATGGFWERGIPIDDAFYPNDPPADADGSGQCWLTENQLGTSDVDGGAVLLSSPELDLASAVLEVDYAYFLRLSNATGNDALIVEASPTGAGGPFTELLRHTSDNGLAWTTHTLTRADFDAAGVTPSATTVLRFAAIDAFPASIVEAAVDAFEVRRITCDDALGSDDQNCTPNPNSSGASAVLTAQGSALIAANSVGLDVTGLPPNQFGYFLMSRVTNNVSVSDGVLCLGLPFVRFAQDILHSGTQGEVSFSPDLAHLPQNTTFLAGESWYFQYWYRDLNPGNVSNLSSSRCITWQ
jgi:hypothetical protein